MAVCLVDSDVLIWLLRGQERTIDLIGRASDEFELAISVITRTEILMGMRDSEAGATHRLLESMVSIDVTTDVADCAGELVRAWRGRGFDLSVPDTVIAATVLQNDLVFLTYNQKHFPMQDIRFFSIEP